MRDAPSGSRAAQSYQRSRNRTPLTQASPFRLVEHERANILRAAGRTVTATVYVDQLQNLIGAIREKRPRRSTVHLLHDNARLHVVSNTHQKIAELGWHPVTHPSYSPNLAPLDYRLFHPLKLHLRGKQLCLYIRCK
ncbi:hypothetical protein WR25_16754 [Diploscapter pachys]|uniref:Tc1-like transposase DDE domain-containing protein n=1 Tax=Diploscapter pachys TaxID=2018661 RepID=A0A2A2KZW9_9BILA|nr:hypothetical protein WR25_16754 [Diploscapter pachys]